MRSPIGNVSQFTIPQHREISYHLNERSTTDRYTYTPSPFYLLLSLIRVRIFIAYISFMENQNA